MFNKLQNSHFKFKLECRKVESPFISRYKYNPQDEKLKNEDQNQKIVSPLVYFNLPQST